MMYGSIFVIDQEICLRDHMSRRIFRPSVWLTPIFLVVQVDLDAILSRAEMREEEEEVPQSEANKELLAAFKCTTLTFEETEKDMEMEGRNILHQSLKTSGH
jgi:hypothetical protein